MLLEILISSEKSIFAMYTLQCIIIVHENNFYLKFHNFIWKINFCNVHPPTYIISKVVIVHENIFYLRDENIFSYILNICLDWFIIYYIIIYYKLVYLIYNLFPDKWSPITAINNISTTILINGVNTSKYNHANSDPDIFLGLGFLTIWSIA